MKNTPKSKNNIWTLLITYKWHIIAITILTMISSALALIVPKIISVSIDNYSSGNFVLQNAILELLAIAMLIFVFTYLSSIAQTYAAEIVARNLRDQLILKISQQDFAFVEKITSATLLTNLTADIDAIKFFVSMAISSLISSVILIIGAAFILFATDHKLALAILSVIPIIMAAFFIVTEKVKKLFTKASESIDRLNKVINESILGAALVRLLNSQNYENQKFNDANTEYKKISFSILRYFATLIPLINFTTNMATMVILALGGYFVISGRMTLGSFAAFNNYLAIIIFPIIIIGFTSTIISQASASYSRIEKIIQTPKTATEDNLKTTIEGNIEVKDLNQIYDGKNVLKNINLTIKAHTRTAIIGPTAAGKTQLIYALIGLTKPVLGKIEYDDININNYDKIAFYQQIGLVFQDSIIFNTTLRENIAFSSTVSDAELQKAIETAQLNDFIEKLPKKLDTIVSERGTSLSGGQKQRIMLARALAIDPQILLLDDFTARVDPKTENKILSNVIKNYPGITLVSVTEKIASIENYDHIILLMEGEVIAQGTHSQLLKSSPEYVQIYNSQKSTNQYELQA